MGTGMFRLLNSDGALSGAINLTGAFVIESGGLASLFLNGNVTLTGGGMVTLIDGARIRGSGILTNANTIQGSSNVNGSFGLDEIGIVNQAGGVIDANVTGQFLRVDPNAASGLVNQGTMRASNGGILLLNGAGGGGFNNTAGTISALDGSEVRLQAGAEISGGTLSTVGTGMFRLLNTDGALSGAINLTGAFVVEATSLATLSLNGNVTLAGGGTFTLIQAGRVGGSGILTNANTIAGWSNVNGSFGLNQIGIVNQASGLIDANVNGEFLRVDPNAASGLVNDGTMQASNGGILLLTGAGGGGFDNRGTISAVTGGTLRFDGAVTSSGTVDVGSGTLTSNASGSFTMTGGGFFLAGGSVQSSNPLSFQGGFANGFGTITAAIMNNTNLRPGLGGTGLAVTGNVTLLGGSNLLLQLGGLAQGSQSVSSTSTAPFRSAASSSFPSSTASSPRRVIPSPSSPPPPRSAACSLTSLPAGA